MDKDELKAARNKMGITQAELAKRLGCTGQAVYFWEAGKREIPASVAKLVRVLVAID